MPSFIFQLFGTKHGPMAKRDSPRGFSDVESIDLFGSHVTVASPLAGDVNTASFDDGPLGPAPTRLELETFDEIVNQSILSAQVGAGLELPWEQGIFRAIFSEEPLCSLPEIPIPTQAISVNRSDGVLDERLAEQPSGKRQKCSQYIHGLYDRAISFSHGLSDHELDAAKWARVLEKLYTIFTCCPEAKPVGLDLHPADMAGNFKRIRELCGSRSCNTVLKRTNNLWKYCRWHQKFFYQKSPLPFTPSDIAEYIWESHQDGATYSALRSFTEAVNFGIHILGLPTRALGQPIIDSFTRGLLDKAAMSRPGRKQARPLTVKEVCHLEACLNDTSMNLFDRYAAGVFLFAIFGRCRWSDLKSVDSFELDIAIDNSTPCGFISFATFNHKTAAQVAKHGLPLPLVSPICGLESPPWGLSWKAVAEEAEIDFSEAYKGPVLPAPLKTGKWGMRSVTSSEATKWLNAILAKAGEVTDRVTSHSLKCTALSWLAKAGANGEHRLVLGHHSSGRGSLEAYSRDCLAAPLRTLEEVLRQIRVGALQPDRTRSGMIQAAIKEDCRAPKPPEGGPSPHDNESGSPDNKSDSSSSSSASTSSSDSEEDNHDSRVCELGKDLSHKQSWGNGKMYQHITSKVVHLESVAETRQFECGIHASSEHVAVQETAFLETRKCKRCQRAIGEL